MKPQAVWIMIETYEEGADVSVGIYHNKEDALEDMQESIHERGWAPDHVISKDGTRVDCFNDSIRVEPRVIL